MIDAAWLPEHWQGVQQLCAHAWCRSSAHGFNLHDTKQKPVKMYA